MSIKIVLPGHKGKPRTAMGTRVYTDDGQEIKGVKEIKINFPHNDYLTADITVDVSTIENLEFLHENVNVLPVGKDMLKYSVERHGCMLIHSKSSFKERLKALFFRGSL